MPFTEANSEQLNHRLLELHSLRAKVGEIWLNGDIDQHVVELSIIRMLNIANSYKFRRILMPINSGGGSVDEGLALLDVINLMPIEVWTINMGRCHSMAVDVFLAGDRRLTLPRAHFMVHTMSAGLRPVKLGDYKAWGDALQRQQNDRAEWYASRTKKKGKKFWQEILEMKDHWFSAEEAVELGIATGYANDFNELFTNAYAEGQDEVVSSKDI